MKPIKTYIKRIRPYIKLRNTYTNQVKTIQQNLPEAPPDYLAMVYKLPDRQTLSQGNEETLQSGH